MDSVSDIDLAKINIMGVSLVRMVSFVSEAAMVLGGVVPFIPQYLDIRRSRMVQKENAL